MSHLSKMFNVRYFREHFCPRAVKVPQSLKVNSRLLSLLRRARPERRGCGTSSCHPPVASPSWIMPTSQRKRAAASMPRRSLTARRLVRLRD